jgi:hypothetical protein
MMLDATATKALTATLESVLQMSVVHQMAALPIHWLAQAVETAALDLAIMELANHHVIPHKHLEVWTMVVTAL